MTSRADRAQRAGRGVAAAAVATFVATLSHASVSATVPSAVNIVLALCVAAPVCVVLAGRVSSWWRLSAAVVTSQALFHGLLALDLRGGGAMASTGHHGDVSSFLEATASAHGAVGHAPEAPWMWAAHALAALVTIVALGRGERAVLAVARFLVAVVRAIRPFRGLRPVTDAVPAASEPLLPTLAMTVLSPMRYRGPPRAA